jgi:hypothetical protein
MSTEEEIIKTAAAVLKVAAEAVLNAVKNKDAERLKQLEAAIGQVSQGGKTRDALAAARGRLRRP